MSNIRSIRILGLFEYSNTKLTLYSNTKLVFDDRPSNDKKKKSGKNKGGKWVDHMTIPCFTTKVRTDDLKAMDNYTVRKPTYIYNIKNRDDDLCFLRYIIVTKYLSLEHHSPYLKYENEKEQFKNYYISRRLPQINPEELYKMDCLLPFIQYPLGEINEKAMSIRRKYFGDMVLNELREKKIPFTKEYQLDCMGFKDYLNRLTIFPSMRMIVTLLKSLRI